MKSFALVVAERGLRNNEVEVFSIFYGNSRMKIENLVFGQDSEFPTFSRGKPPPLRLITAQFFLIT